MKKNVRMRQKRRAPKRRNWLKIFLLLIAFLGLLVLAGWWYASHRTEAGQKAVRQDTSDTPIYILVVGADNQTPAEADTIVLAAINQKKEQAGVISLLPNTLTEKKEKENLDTLRLAYRMGGMALLKTKVESLFHIFIPYYVQFDQANFVSWVDNKGLLGLYVEQDMYHETDGRPDINFKQGYAELNGQEAYAYLRYRQGNDGELQRVQRQQRFIKTLAKKWQHHYRLLNAVFVYRSWSKVQSNINAWDAAQLTYFLSGLPADKWTYFISPGEIKIQNNLAFWDPDPIGMQNIIGVIMKDDGKVE